MAIANPETVWTGLEEQREILRCFLRRHSADENEIDDVVQETFVRAARYRARLSDPARLRAWTMRIALNVLSDARRRGRRVSVASSRDGALEGLVAEGPEGPEEEEEEEEAEFRVGSFVFSKQVALRHLREAVAALREDERLLLGSFYGGEGSCRATARECGVPPHLVKIRLFRARRRLLRLLRRRLARTALAGSSAGAS